LQQIGSGKVQAKDESARFGGWIGWGAGFESLLPAVWLPSHMRNLSFDIGCGDAIAC